MSEKITIIGSGLVGSLWAYILQKRGFDVEVFEKRPDPKNLEAPAGRSINLVLTSRGIRGLEVAGLIQKILPLAVPVYGRCIHNKKGETVFQPYGRDKSECNYSISRWDLNKALIQACLSIGVKIFFEHELDCINVMIKKIGFKNSQQHIEKNYQRLFATDGAGSVIRKELVHKFPQSYSETVDWLQSDYKELNLPKAGTGESLLAKNELHIWPRGSHMMMGLANADNSMTMTLYLPKKDHPYSFDQLKTNSDVEKMFLSEFQDVVELMPHYKSEFMNHAQGKLATVRFNKWHFEDSIGFLGDAAHAIVPFFGQGTNLGFEDCTTLIELYDSSKKDWNKALASYNELQRPNANAIAEMALENFSEMRDKVGDSQFQFKKKIESLIEKEFPEMYRSRYGLITYTLVPYALALVIGKKQSEFLDQIIADIKDVEELNLTAVKQKLEITFTPWLRSLGVSLATYKPNI